MSPLKAFVVLLVLRLGAVFVLQTSFVPDEYWQSLEVAHHLTFGYGYITWEWRQGIRSYFYPSIIAFIYKGLQWMEMDSCYNLTTVPRIFQALVSTVSDYCIWLWVCREVKISSGGVVLFSIAISWFWFYCCSRTLSNTLETSLTAMALYFFPWKERRIRSSGGISFLWFVGLACMMRPTAAILWIPLCIYHLSTVSRNIVTVLCREYLPIGTVYVIISTLVDSYFYKRLVFSPFNFMYFNIVQNIAKFYGTHPAHWYITSGLPVVLGSHLVPFIISCGKFVILPLLQYQKTRLPLFQYQKNALVCLVSIAWTLAIYSCLPHKEFRFILPLLPMALYISSIWLIFFHKTAHRFAILLLDVVLLLGAVIPSLYLGIVHQRGTLVVMQELGLDAVHNPLHTNILFLMPCHSTPLYSHLHVNVSTRFLTCDPFHEGDKDEADEFYESPELWLTKYFLTSHSHPSHIIIYDKLYPLLSHFFSLRNYAVFSCIFHAHMVEGRVGHQIYVLKQKE